MKLFLGLCAAFLLAGCVTAQPKLNLGDPQQVMVKDKDGAVHPYSYVAIKSGGTFLDSMVGFSIFNERADHVLTSITPNPGLLEALGAAAMPLVTPAASVLGITK